MAAFDLLKIETELPDGLRPEGIIFQTKDLSCEGEVYTITRNGRLTDAVTGDNHYEGVLNFYTVVYPRTWHEYHAEFKFGQLQSIVEVHT